MEVKNNKIVIMGSFNPPTLAQNTRVDDWKGQNLLGCALMEVRDWLKVQE
jgi:predicted NAD-dependent protein-ADP-ribosyltransferase YbiA (DUF1768 family)